MTTLKEHQQAMVQLLASGSGIPASAARLAHAMHDVLTVLNSGAVGSRALAEISVELMGHKDATTPGLNDRALAEDIKAFRPKLTPAERRVKELENTIKQLKYNNAVLRQQKGDLETAYYNCFKALEAITADSPAAVKLPEQSGVRKEDTQVCEHEWFFSADGGPGIGEGWFCNKCGCAK